MRNHQLLVPALLTLSSIAGGCVQAAPSSEDITAMPGAADILSNDSVQRELQVAEAGCQPETQSCYEVRRDLFAAAQRRLQESSTRWSRTSRGCSIAAREYVDNEWRSANIGLVAGGSGDAATTVGAIAISGTVGRESLELASVAVTRATDAPRVLAMLVTSGAVVLCGASAPRKLLPVRFVGGHYERLSSTRAARGSQPSPTWVAMTENYDHARYAAAIIAEALSCGRDLDPCYELRKSSFACLAIQTEIDQTSVCLEALAYRDSCAIGGDAAIQQRIAEHQGANEFCGQEAARASCGFATP